MPQFNPLFMQVLHANKKAKYRKSNMYLCHIILLRLKTMSYSNYWKSLIFLIMCHLMQVLRRQGEESQLCLYITFFSTVPQREVQNNVVLSISEEFRIVQLSICL